MRRIILLLLGLLAFSIPSLKAQELKIGYLDPQAVLTRMPEMAAVEQKLKNFAEKKQKELIDKQTILQQQLELYQQKQAVISEDARKKEEAKLQQMNQEIMDLQNQSQVQLQQRQAELMGPLLEQIQNAINSVSKEMGLTYVFNAVTSQGDFVILYASDEMQSKYDITEKVMEFLDL
jgi:outer membrane protein